MDPIKLESGAKKKKKKKKKKMKEQIKERESPFPFFFNFVNPVPFRSVVAFVVFLD